jgi:hypothetical protein
MITITQPQAQKRFLLIPLALQDALFSVQTAAIIDQICTDNHLDVKRSNALVEAVGWVLLGFLHPEDIKKELEQASIPAPMTQDILNSLNTKIFNVLNPLLSKTYAPLPREESVPEPVIIKNTDISPTLSAIKSALPPANKTPTILSDVGWSKMPMTPIPPRPATIPVPTSAAPAKPAEPAPMMLHEDTTFKPAEKNEGFTLQKPNASAEMHMGTGVPQAPIRPAVLEFGGMKTPVPKPPALITGGTYHGELRPPLSSAPIAGIGSRNVSQIMPAVPVSVPTPLPKPLAATPISAGSIPTPPRPPQETAQIPKPPTPPPQNSKPIVKDFL